MPSRTHWKGLSIALHATHLGADMVCRVEAVPAKTWSPEIDKKMQRFAGDYLTMLGKLIAFDKLGKVLERKKGSLYITLPNGMKHYDDNIEQMIEVVAAAHGVTEGSPSWQQRVLRVPGNDGAHLTRW